MISLTRNVIKVASAASGAEAIVAVRRADADRPFDVLLLDWRMPRIDGVETTRRIRADGSLKSMPAIVIVTAFGREEVRGEAELAGVNGFLIKPVNQSTTSDAKTRKTGAPDTIRTCGLRLRRANAHVPNAGTTDLINRKNGVLQAPSNHAAACLFTPRYVALRNRAMALS
jgi:CheY-like chemotaxis protein